MRVPPGRAVVILGSSRSDGHTRRAVDAVLGARAVRIVDLSRLRISPYDYAHRNAGDDFLRTVESIVPASLWILATPVYWFSMSAPLKTFVDRLSDLFEVREDLGRRLEGKSLALVATGAGGGLPAGFQAPFRHLCEYAGMRYAGAFYARFHDSGRPYPRLAARAKKAGDAWLV